MYQINKNCCINCGTCASACPVDAISDNGDSYVIDKSRCLQCGTCAGLCPCACIEDD